MAYTPEEAAHAAKNIEQQLRTVLREAQDNGLFLTAAAVDFAIVVLADDLARIGSRNGGS